MSKKLVTSLFVVAGTLALPTLVQAAGTAIAIDALKINQSNTYGPYLTDGAGRPLYMFTADKQAQGSNGAESMCLNPCLSAWPKAQATFTKPTAGSMVQTDKIGLMTRSDGTLQVTYGGSPLYYFFKDQGKTAPAGQNVQAFGGQWHLVAPDGSEIDHQAS